MEEISFATSIFSVKLIFCKAFYPMGQKALQKTFATSHGKKSFAQIVIFRQFDEFFNNSAKKLMIFNQFDGKTAIEVIFH